MSKFVFIFFTAIALMVAVVSDARAEEASDKLEVSFEAVLSGNAARVFSNEYYSQFMLNADMSVNAIFDNIPALSNFLKFNNFTIKPLLGLSIVDVSKSFQRTKKEGIPPVESSFSVSILQDFYTGLVFDFENYFASISSTYYNRYYNNWFGVNILKIGYKKDKYNGGVSFMFNNYGNFIFTPGIFSGYKFAEMK